MGVATPARTRSRTGSEKDVAMPNHVTALFRDRLATHVAVEQLVQSGFPRDDISVLMSERTHEREFATSGVCMTGAAAATAGVLCTIVTGLAHLGTLSIQRFELLGAGPLVAAMGMRGAVGGLAGVLMSAGVPQRVACDVAARLNAAGILVGVLASPTRVELAKQVLKLSGGEWLRAA